MSSGFSEGVPPQAAWEHVAARSGFEVTFFDALDGGGHRIEGSTCGVEDGVGWVVRYVVEVDDLWRSRRAEVWGRTADGAARRVLEGDGAGGWRVDGARDASLDGCLDVDLEASACTNTLAVHRSALTVGDEVDAPAAYVRADGLGIERLDQRYRRLPDGSDEGTGRVIRFHYDAPRFDYAATLAFDRQGLVLDYPGLARRVR